MNQKTEIIKYLSNLIDSRISEINAAIILLKESRDNESKSSAGDKYETGRAMAQIELDKLQQQLQHQINLRAEVAKIQPDLLNESISFGSLVSTNTGLYFLSVGLGKLQLNDQEIYVISLASPVGKALKGAKAGDSIPYNGQNIQIFSIH